MFAVWNDHAGNGISTKDIHYRVFPAMQTLAVKMWTGKDCTVPYADFNSARMAISEAPGVNVAGRIGTEPRSVYNLETLKPGMETGLKRDWLSLYRLFRYQSGGGGKGNRIVSFA